VGVWGPAIFSDDTACDVRDSYRDLVTEGVDGSEATRRVLADCASSLSDVDDAPVVWLALAATQAAVGRLEDEVRDQALAVINSGADLARWRSDQPKHLAKRAAALERLRAKLLGPQRPPTRLRVRPKSICLFKPGDLVEFRTSDGHRVLLVMLGQHHDRGGDYARVGLLDWDDSRRFPTPRQLRRTGLAIDPRPMKLSLSDRLGFLMIAAARGDVDVLRTRCRVVDHVPSDAACRSSRPSEPAITWSRLDDWFADGLVRNPRRSLPGTRALLGLVSATTVCRPKTNNRRPNRSSGGCPDIAGRGTANPTPTHHRIGTRRRRGVWRVGRWGHRERRLLGLGPGIVGRSGGGCRRGHRRSVSCTALQDA
jgi:hypothetical protein